ncbi:MAG: NapC/NirT family cytochrome c [Steroidobacteraceae bacterium]
MLCRVKVCTRRLGTHTDTVGKHMAQEGNTDTGSKRPSLWARLWNRPKSRWLLGIPIGGFLMLVVGAVALGSVNWVVHETSSTEFCFACHSHQNFIRPEYEASVHFKNGAGVRAGCSDCHLPHDNWFELMYTKVVVSADIIPELAGKISTAEKYEAHRGEMAQTVWREMLGNDSRFCRSCHSFDAMNLEAQGRMPSRKHAAAIKSGQTCVECHRGVAHKLPENEEQLWNEVQAKSGH